MYDRQEATKFRYKGQVIHINRSSPVTHDLSALQKLHVLNQINVYEPIKSHEEKWETKTKRTGYWEDYVDARPIPSTRRRNDLPPIYMQWKDDWSRRVKLLQKSKRTK